MSVWATLVGKKVFLRLKNDRVYDATITSVDTSSPPLIFISFTDRYNHPVTVVHSEIVELKEEG